MAVQLGAVEIERAPLPFACGHFGLEMGQPAGRHLGKGEPRRDRELADARDVLEQRALSLRLAGRRRTQCAKARPSLNHRRQVTVYVPPDAPEAVVFAGDGQLISQWGGVLEAADVPSTMIVGVHRLADETQRLHEYSPGFDPERFAAHATFFVEDVRRWARLRFGVALPTERTAVFGVSAGGELALAIGLRHPDIYGAVFCASPGGGYRPPDVMPSSIPRAYLVAGTMELFFHENATRWAEALRDAGADVVMTDRVGSHGDAFWREEFPLMVAWAFG